MILYFITNTSFSLNFKIAFFILYFNILYSICLPIFTVEYCYFAMCPIFFLSSTLNRLSIINFNVILLYYILCNFPKLSCCITVSFFFWIYVLLFFSYVSFLAIIFASFSSILFLSSACLALNSDICFIMYF